MNIVVSFKVVPDDQDIQVAGDGSLDFSKAHRIVSAYDLNAEKEGNEKMNIVVSFKVVPDDQDIQVAGDGSLDFSKAHRIVSAYDLNALEAAAQLVASDNEGSTTCAVTVGASKIDDSKLKKNILARGIDTLVMRADDAYADTASTPS